MAGWPSASTASSCCWRAPTRSARLSPSRRPSERPIHSPRRPRRWIRHSSATSGSASSSEPRSGGRLAPAEQPPHREPRAHRGMVVDALERGAALHELLGEPGDGVLEVALVERAMLGDHVTHTLARHARPARGALAALRAATVPGEHLGHARTAPAVLERGEPEVPVLRAVDEDGIIAAGLLPDLPP